MKIYVASSWRNEIQPKVVEILRELGHEVYDFKNPTEGDKGFSWASIDPNWMDWTPEEYKAALNYPVAIDGFNSDLNAMKWADCCVMVLPCGRSANTEAGWLKGQGKQVFVFQPDKQEPELMYKIYDGIITTFSDLQILFTRASVKNEDSITVEEVSDKYQPNIWSTCDQITNLSDQYLGTYAYTLQEHILQETNKPILKSLSFENVLVDKMLSCDSLPMELITIRKEVHTNPNMTNFELSFQVWKNGMGRTVVLRNGYILKCMLEAKMTSFNDLVDYEAVLIYNSASVNPDFCSFVKFSKKEKETLELK